jgi:hypothetical protein
MAGKYRIVELNLARKKCYDLYYERYLRSCGHTRDVMHRLVDLANNAWVIHPGRRAGDEQPQFSFNCRWS